jgi:predicted metal-dependent peptidase
MIPNATPEQERVLTTARINVILRDPFFASILMEMNQAVSADETETCATDGERVIFNPDWLDQADMKLVAAAMRKMSLHVALSHHLRRGPVRNPARWRAACDQAALHIMQGEGVELPEGQMANPMFDGMSAEEIYKHLKEQDDDSQDDQGQEPQGAPQGGAGDGQGDGQGDQPGNGPAGDKPGADGGVGQSLDGADMNSPADVSQKQAENDQRIERAAMNAKAKGNESATSKDLLEAIRAKGVDWRDRLNAFIDDRAETRLSWSKPNRRFVGQDIYLPGKTSNGINTLAFIVDTSGSMSNDELSMCMTQIEAAREGIGIKKVTVIQIDTKVKAIDEFEKDEPLPTSLEFHGRGGTDMAPAFEAAMDAEPTVIICMTDGVFPKLTDDPGVPTLFAITHAGRQGEAPATFGDYVDMPAPDAA